MSKDLKDKTKKDLEKLLVEARENLRKFKFNVSGSRTRNIKEGREKRRQIAKILTELNKK